MIKGWHQPKSKRHITTTKSLKKTQNVFICYSLCPGAYFIILYSVVFKKSGNAHPILVWERLSQMPISYQCIPSYYRYYHLLKWKLFTCWMNKCFGSIPQLSRAFVASVPTCLKHNESWWAKTIGILFQYYFNGTFVRKE